MNVTISSLISKTLSHSPFFTQKSLTLRHSSFIYKPISVFYNVKKLNIDSSSFKNSFGPVILNEVSYNGDTFSSRITSNSGTLSLINCGFYNISTSNDGCAISCVNTELAVQGTYFVSCYTTGTGIIRISSSSLCNIHSSKAEDCFGTKSNFLYSDTTTQNTIYQLLMIDCAPASKPNTDLCMYLTGDDLSLTYSNSTRCNTFNDGAFCLVNTKKTMEINHNIAISASGKNLFLISSQIDSYVLSNLIFLSCSAQQGIISTKSQSTISQSIFYNTKGRQGFPIFSTLTFTKCYFNTELPQNSNIIYDDCVYTITNIDELLRGATDNFVYPNIGRSPITHNYIDDQLPQRTPEMTKNNGFQLNASGIMIFVIWISAIILIVVLFFYWLATRKVHVTVVEEYHKEIQKEYVEQKPNEKESVKPLLDDHNEIDVDQQPKPIWVHE